MSKFSRSMALIAVGTFIFSTSSEIRADNNFKVGVSFSYLNGVSELKTAIPADTAAPSIIGTKKRSGGFSGQAHFEYGQRISSHNLYFGGGITLGQSALNLEGGYAKQGISNPADPMDGKLVQTYHLKFGHFVGLYGKVGYFFSPHFMLFVKMGLNYNFATYRARSPYRAITIPQQGANAAIKVETDESVRAIILHPEVGIEGVVNDNWSWHASVGYGYVGTLTLRYDHYTKKPQYWTASAGLSYHFSI